VTFVWANHHRWYEDLAATKKHNLILIDYARLLEGQPFFEDWKPAKITVGSIHVLRFVLLIDFPVLFFKFYVFVLLSEYEPLFF